MSERDQIKPLLTPAGSKLELIRAYGQFWRADEIDWDARGRADDGLPRFALLGHLGNLSRKAALVADMREQRGLYILYGNYGPYYVGVTTRRGLGTRLREHLGDAHEGRWDRFSWFGFCAVEPPAKPPGPATLVSMAMSSEATVVRSKVITQMESLLIHAMGPRNLHLDPASLVSEEWKQVTRAERERGLKQLG
jgi:hypothetical protein